MKNDIQLADTNNMKMTSTHHAVLVQVGKGILIIDTSLNGTYVNGRRVKRSVLSSGDVIRFGKKGGSSGLFTFTGPFQTKKTTEIRSAMSTESVLSCLKCELCLNYSVFPTELSPCSHLFCHPCLSSKVWESCARCQTYTNTYKLTVKYNLVDIITNLLKLVLTNADYAIYLERHNTWKSKLVDNQMLLLNLKKKSQLCNISDSDPFLLISQTWTEYERLKFKKGIHKYSFGEPREYFCWLVRLTAHWVQFEANPTDLKIAAQNLGISSYNNADALLRFIYNNE